MLFGDNEQLEMKLLNLKLVSKFSNGLQLRRSELQFLVSFSFTKVFL